jgi:hypothetical protein
MPRQGINVLTFDPEYQQMASQELVNDIISLGSALPPDQSPLMVRSKVTSAPSDNDMAAQIPIYAEAFRRYAASYISTAAILPLEFDRPNNFNPMAPLSEDGKSNDYLEDFSYRAMDFASRMLDGVRSYFIWNEPNNVGNANYLDEAHFAALLNLCYNRMKSVAGIRQIAMGSLLWPLGATEEFRVPANCTEVVRAYLANVKSWLDSHAMGEPFDAITVNINHFNPDSLCYSLADMQYLRDCLVGPEGVYPGKTLLIGEWGLTTAEASLPDATATAYSYLKSICGAMWYFQHTLFSNGGESWGATNWYTDGYDPLGPALVKPANHLDVWGQLNELYSCTHVQDTLVRAGKKRA